MKFFLTIFFISVTTAFSQELTLVNKAALQVDHFVGFDAYKHIYFIKNGALHKEGELGKFVFQDLVKDV